MPGISASRRHTTILVVGSFATIAVVNYAFWRRRQAKKEQEYPPLAPAGIGETIKLISGSTYPSFMLRMAKEVQSYTFRVNLPILGTPMVVAVGDVETHRAILTDRSTTRPVEIMYKTFDNITGGIPSIFSTNGDYWHKRRKLLAPAFAVGQVKRMNSVALEKTELWIQKRLLPLIQNGQSFDIGEEVLGIILSALCETAFEYQMSNNEKAQYMVELDICLKEFLFKSTTNPLRPLLGRLLPERRRAHLAAERLMDVAKSIIDNYRTLKSPTEDTIIDRLMKGDVYQNDRERQADIVFLLIAGHDTTGYSISWTLLELARNPGALKAVRESLVELQPEDWGKSESLKNAVKESLRLHPAAAAGSIRVIGNDMVTAAGYRLPKGSIIFLPLILLHRNSNIFDSPGCYQPSRWEDATKEMNEAFLPFSLGKQNCVGQALAKVELHSVVARICSEFDLKVEVEGRTEYFLTLKPIGFKLTARKVTP